MGSHLSKMYVGLGGSDGEYLGESVSELNYERENFFEERLVSKAGGGNFLEGDKGAFLVRNSIGSGKKGKAERKSGK